MMRLYDLRAALQRRHRGGSDEGSALLMTVVFTLFAGGIMLVLLSVLLSQMQAIQLAQKNTRTGYAAQAGIQATLSILRSNTQSKVVAGTAADYGNPLKLPQEFSGTVDGGELVYSVTVKYYAEDPTNKDSAWLDAKNLKFLPGDAPPKQPRFARIVSTGRDAGSAADPGMNRTVTALYTFTTTNVNIPGGQINLKNSTSCLRAVSATQNSLIKVASGTDCQNEQLTLWVYDTDYQLKLASTIGTSIVLCITGQKWLSTTSGTDSSTVDARLYPCNGSNKDAEGNQLWSWDSQGSDRSWEGQDKKNENRSQRWLVLDGSVLKEKKRTRADAKPPQIGEPFQPTPKVGAGGASIKTKQIVNYFEFGRCMDVTGESIEADYMIVYPCKQDPTLSGANLRWNHKWSYNEPVAPSKTSGSQTITVESPSGKRCLEAPASINSEVSFETCKSTTKAQQFVRNTDTGGITTSYTFQLNANHSLCLAAVRDPGAKDIPEWSRIRVMPCNGSTTQKWNAPPQTSGSSLGGYKEIG